MQLNIQGKQLDLGDALKTHVEDKLEDLNQKYFNNATYANVTFSREGHGHGQIKTHISVSIGKNIMVMADALQGDPYASFDAASEKVAKQMRRYKKRLRDHHHRLETLPEADIIPARDAVISPDHHDNDDVPHGDDPVIVAEMTTAIQTMTVSEAVMRMDLAGKNAMLFRNASHNGLNMVYRRADGNVGWVDPEAIADSNAQKSKTA